MGHGTSSGPVLGMVAVTLWFLMVSDDVTTTLDLGGAQGAAT